MDGLRGIKSRIYNEQKVPTLLEALGCDEIRTEQHGSLIVCQLPARFGSDNKRSVQVKATDALWGNIRSRSITGDIYTLVGYIKWGYADFDDIKKNIHEIKSWICETLGYEDDVWRGEIAKDWIAWLRPIQKQRPKEIYRFDNKVLDEAILDKYVPCGHIAWANEGISLATQSLFGVRFDMDSERIVYPIHNADGEFVGVKGRYVGTDTHIHSNYKYLALVPYAKSVELYNLHRAKSHIVEQKQIIVVESAKSCMKLTQWGFPNCVSLEGLDISSAQAQHLKKFGVPIVFAWDKGITWQDVQQKTSALKSRLIYCAYDNLDLLIDKDSPTDRGIEVWQKLLENKSKIY